jgi:hypothetical protein
MTNKLKRALAEALALGLSASATATLLPINNASFEDPVVADGQQNGGGYAVPGWVELDEQYAWAFDIFNPDVVTIPAEAHSGQSVLMSMAYRPATQYVEQQLAATLQPNTRYTLSAWVADPDAKSPLNNVRLMLYAGTSLLGSTTVQPVGADVWTSGSLVLDTGASHPEAGHPLKVRLMWGDHASYRILVDDVALDATSLATNLPTAPVALTAAAFGPTAIDLAWRPGDGVAMGYRIERALGSGAFALIATLPVDATTYRDLFLPASTSCSYRLSAFNDLGNSTPATVSAKTVAGDPKALPGPAFANVWDYGYLWWQNGLNDPVYRIKTSHYAMSFQTTTLGPTALFPLSSPPSESAALTESSAAAFPSASLVTFSCRVSANGTTNAVASTSSSIRDAQLVECGKFFQRRWHKVSLPGALGLNVQQSGLEVAAWPDRLSFVLRLTPTNTVSNGMMEMTLGLTNAYGTRLTNGAGSALLAADGSGFVFLKSLGSSSLVVDQAQSLVTVRTATSNWVAGQEYSVGMIVYPVATNVAGALDTVVASETSPLIVTATEVVPAVTNLVTSYDADRGWHQVTLHKDAALGDNGIVRTRLCVTNDSSSPRVLRLNLNGVLFYIPGLTAVIRDEQLNPLGIPVQLSKNWHTSTPAERFQGEWFHGLTMLTVPAGTVLNFEVVMVGQNWGGMPAATHSQLSVIGYNGQGASQWDEAALGNFGEALCYDMDHGLTDNDCTDSRPMLVINAQGKRGAWCGNAGGGSFLRCFDTSGNQRRHSQIRTRYARYGPNLADVAYAGRTTDSALEFSYTAGLFRSDDYTRGLHRIRIDVQADTAFSRLAFYQQAGDTYAYNQGTTLAYGDAANLTPLRQWAATIGQNKYIGTPVALTGPMPWAAGLDAPAETGYSAANGGFVIRSWKARINGSNNVPPYLVERSVAGAAIFDLVPPPGVTMLKAGDYLEAEIVRFYVPKFATNYYGPNASFRVALTNYENSYRLALREAVGNNLSVTVQTGTLVHLFPAQIQVTNNQAAFTVTGGLGAVPFTFSGLSDYRQPVLEENVGGVWTPLDQSVHGNDFWQCDYDAEAGAWAITFTVKLDGTNYQSVESLMNSPQTRSFRFRLAAAAKTGTRTLTLFNAGFEAPVLPEGQEDSADGYIVPGWVEFGETFPWAWDVGHPAAASMSAHGGQNVLSSVAYNAGTQYLEQQLPDTLELNTRYTLSAWAADPDGHNPLNNVHLMLYVGSSLLSTATIQPALAATWASNSLVLVVGNAHPQAGQALKVRIMWGDHASYRVFVDDVSLTATYAVPRFLSATPLADGNLAFSVSGVVGQSYALLMGTNFAQPLSNWAVLDTGMITTTPFTLQDFTASNSLQRFYALRAY